MAIVFPRDDIFDAVDFEPSGYDFSLFERQEFSRTSGGKTLGKSLGDPAWILSVMTRPLYLDDLLEFEAKLRSLDGVVRAFYAYDLRRPYPKEHAAGVFNDTGSIFSVGANNDSIRVDGLDSGFKVSAGDYLSIEYPAGWLALHQAMEAATADSEGLTPSFQVRPHIRTGLVSSPAASVTFKTPKTTFRLDPGSLRSSMIGGVHGQVSFSAFQDTESA